MTNPKNKGNSFERKIANLFSDHFKDTTGIAKAFRRNADSGSFFGGSNVKRTESHDTGKATFGDIICPNSFKFSIECKHYKAPPSMGLIIKQDVKDWDKWIDQAKQDSVSSSKAMMVIIKYNNVEEMVILTDTMGIKPIINYKEYFVVSLDDLLKLPHSNFFE